MKKEIPYKKKQITIEVLLIDPQPSLHKDTAPRYTLRAWFSVKEKGNWIDNGFVHQIDVSDLHLNGEIDKAEAEVKKEIARQEKVETEKALALEVQSKKLTAKGFK